MKQLLTTIAALVLVVGCGGPPKDIREAARQGNIEAVKQYLADGVDVNAKDDWVKLLCIVRLKCVARKSLNC